MKSKQNIILEEIYLNNKSQKELADSLKVSKSYVSQIINKAKMLRIPIKFVNNKLVCAKCEKECNKLMFHHNHHTGEYIALVCRSCNIKFRGNNDFKYAEKDELTTTISFRCPISIVDDVDDRAKKSRLTRTQYLVKMIETFLEVVK